MNLIEWFQRYLLSTGKLIMLGEVALKIIVIFIMARFIIRFAHIAIERVFQLRKRTHVLRYNERKEVTLKKLCQNIIVYLTYFVTAISALETLGINLKVLLAGVSIVGFITGLGSTKCNKRYYNGVFYFI